LEVRLISEIAPAADGQSTVYNVGIMARMDPQRVHMDATRAYSFLSRYYYNV